MNNNFKDLGLSADVLKSIETLGFAEPSKIQKEIIPFIINGHDVVGLAATGTGKTLAYASSILSKLNVSGNTIKAIILTPTRELALQVSEEMETLNKSSNFDILSVFGGSSIELQLRALKRGVDVVVGTPGRIMDLIKRKVLKLDDLEYFVLDEADEMLNMGFLEDIEFIFNKTKKEKQVLLFSATMSETILKLATKYMKDDYQRVEVKSESKTSTNVSQYYYLVNEKMRAEVLCRVIDAKDPHLAIIFCQRKTDVDHLLNELSMRNYSAEAMHGDISQSVRIKTLERFKSGAFTYLIATDVAARGIHVDNIDLVINYNMPQDVESYIHRIGRTGRAGQMGEAISFVTPREVSFLKTVEKVAKCQIIKCELPSLEDIYQTKYNKIIKRVENAINNEEYQECIKYVRDFNKEELIKFSASLLNIVLKKEIGSDFNKEIVIKQDRRDIVDKNYTRVFLTIGKLDNLKKGTLLDFLKNTTKVDKDCFKNIEILSKFTFMDVDNKCVKQVIKKLYNSKLNDRVIRVEEAKKNGGKRG
ncbi:MAG: DEAD/DEAH box helicase [Bacilli bacterium]|nr:DEAD/DEAH box helicase [Bacilli bacterium]